METTGCNLIQLIPVHFEVRSLVDVLGTYNITCEVAQPDVSTDPFAPLQMCVEQFIDSFSMGISECYLPYGDTMDMCQAVKDFKTCVYKIPNLQAKTAVSEMVMMTSSLASVFCLTSTEGGKCTIFSKFYFFKSPDLVKLVNAIWVIG